MFGSDGSLTFGVFVPMHTRGSGLRMLASSQACFSCGHVWSTLNPENLRELLRKHGDELARQDLETFAQSPVQPSTNIPEAAEAYRGVAEIDGRFRAAKPNEATRKYRELTGCTWDRAIEATRGWRDLTRDQKLARFAWQPEPEPDQKHTRPLADSMYDQLLDG